MHESVLRRHVERLGASIELNTELANFTQDESGVSAEILSRRVGQGSPRTLERFSYIIGTDGAKSQCSPHSGLVWIAHHHNAVCLQVSFGKHSVLSSAEAHMTRNEFICSTAR